MTDEQLILTEEEMQLIVFYRKLNESQKKIFLHLTETLKDIFSHKIDNSQKE